MQAGQSEPSEDMPSRYLTLAVTPVFNVTSMQCKNHAAHRKLVDYLQLLCKDHQDAEQHYKQVLFGIALETLGQR